MRRGDHGRAGLAQHRTQIGPRWLATKAEKGQARGFQDHPADGGGHSDDHHGHDVRNDFGQQNAGVAHARKPGGIDEFAMRNAHGYAADVACKKGDVDDSDSDQRVEQPRPQHRDDRQRQKDVGKGHQHVDAAHRYIVRGPAEKASHHPDRRADQPRDQRCGKSHRQR